MPRSAAVRETPQNYRTNPQRLRSGFQPAQRITTPPRGREEVEVEEEEDQGNGRSVSQEAPLTKSGYPDRRFKGQRDLPPPEEENPDFRRARTGGTIGDMHVTIEGKPDRRFKENRSLSDEEVIRRWLDNLNEQFGGGTKRK